MINPILGFVLKMSVFPEYFQHDALFKDGSEYFGPYTSMKTVKTLLGLIKGLYQLRTCNYDLSEEKIEAGKYKVCLEYHLGNCKGPCEDLRNRSRISLQILQPYEKSLKEILKIHCQQFRTQMKELCRANAI